MKAARKRLILCGFGKVGRAFARLLMEKKSLLHDMYRLDLELTAVAEVGGAVASRNGGLPLEALLSHVESGGAPETFPELGRPGLRGSDLIETVEADLLVEATPTNLESGEPGRSHFLAALNRGMDVATANKGPLVLDYRGLHGLAAEKGCRIGMSAATAAALPTLDVGELSLAGSRILSVEGILNGTTNYILTRMHRDGCTYEEGLKAAQAMGIAESDPALDVEGWDTCNKLVLISNRLFGTAFTPRDVPVKGISDIRREDVAVVRRQGRVLKLVGKAETEGPSVLLTVAPVALDPDHPLASIHGSEKGVSYVSDTMGRVTVTGGRSSPVGAAAALLKDIIRLNVTT